ncbi:MAG: CCA tRNA nucleotidyltransferase [Candidatus Woesearchaeota archaeon]
MNDVAILENRYPKKTIIDAISPTAQEKKHLQIIRDLICDQLKQEASRKNFSIEIVPGGSTAKDTFLKGDYDLDIFVRFKKPSKNMSEALEFLILSVGKTIGVPVQRVHGSRDYFTMTYEGFCFEFVPVKYIQSVQDVENITDMSPLHVSWFLQRAPFQLHDDIRLAKQFCKAARVYGAESYINGFSGHVIDILVLYYGGFEQLLEAAASHWQKTPLFIDIENHNPQGLQNLSSSKLQSPLILIDPIDPKRNAAAALLKKCFTKFITQAKEFISHPSKDFFVIPKFSKTILQQSLSSTTYALLLHFTPLQTSKDIAGTKILKCIEFCQRELEDMGFSIHKKDFFFKNENETAHAFFILPKADIKKTYTRQGPPISAKQGVKAFREKHSAAYEKNGYWYVDVQRKFTNAFDALRFLITQPYVTTRCKNVRLESVK